MPKFTIECNSKKNQKESYDLIKKFLESDNSLKALDSKMAFTYDDSNMVAVAKGGQFKANLEVKSVGDGAKVAVTIDLPLLLSPFKGKVQETIERKLAKVLA